MDIAIIGCGKQAPKHISGLRELDEVGHIYVADMFKEHADKLATNQGEDVSSIDIDDVFKTKGIKAVVIATPTPSHKELCEKAILSGKPFLVEKPLASSHTEARELLSLSKEHNVQGMVGFIYRFSPIFDITKTVTANDAQSPIGKPAHAFFRIAGRGSHKAWKHQSSKGGGAINEMLVHMLDLAVWYFGKAVKVNLLENDITQPVRKIEGEDVSCTGEDWSVVSLDMENGTHVVIQSDMNSPLFKQHFEINGANGIIEGSIHDAARNQISLFEERNGYAKGANPVSITGNNLYVAQSRCFIDMVLSNAQPAKCSLEDAVEVMRIQEELHAQNSASKNS